jgi:hypothetical protein
MSLRTLGVGVVLLVLAAPVLADWNEGDPYKMHYPQLPDPLGLDVNFRMSWAVADDWLCTESGPVTDVHFWFSQFSGGQPEVPPVINGVHLSIHANLPADTTTPYSRPGALLWLRDLSPTQVQWRLDGTGQQGWYDSSLGGVYVPNDHTLYYQMNITDFTNPFYQYSGEIYWLDISIQSTRPVGWKTSRSPQFMDTAVWGSVNSPGWQPIYDPREPGANERLDMAFVITPEPAALVLLAVGMLLMRRR